MIALIIYLFLGCLFMGLFREPGKEPYKGVIVLWPLFFFVAVLGGLLCVAYYAGSTIRNILIGDK